MSIIADGVTQASQSAEGIKIALIVAGSAILGNVVTSYLGTRSSRAARAEDRKDRAAVAKQAEDAAALLAQRQDIAEEDAKKAAIEAKKVADAAAIAASDLKDAQEETYRRTEEVARLAATAQQDTADQLSKIHTLVNSDMTTARAAELKEAQISLGLRHKIVDLVRAAGREPSVDDIEAIHWTEARIADLEAILADRAVQQSIVDAKNRDEVARTETRAEHMNRPGLAPEAEPA